MMLASQNTPMDDQTQQTIRFRSQPPPPRPQNIQDFSSVWLCIDNNIKKKYLRTVDSLKNYAQTKSLINFLNDCLVKKVFPKTFQIKSNIDKRFSSKGQNKMNSLLNTVQSEQIKISIKEHHKLECELYKKFSALSNELYLYLETSEIIIVKKELDNRLSKFLQCEKNRYKAKLLNLQNVKKQDFIDNEIRPAEPVNNADKKRNRRFIKRSKYRRKMKRLSQKPLDDLVINYSDYVLSSDEISLFNKHLNFVPLPKKLNVTTLSYDFKRFSRSLRWREAIDLNPEFFSDNSDSNDQPEFSIPIKKFNLPSCQPTRTLSNFLYGIESDLLFNQKKKIFPNVSKGEENALQNLIDKQKSGQIVCLRADKGGASTIVNRNDYISAIEGDHLSSKITNQDGSVLSVYRQIDKVMVSVHYNKIKEALEDAVVDEIIDKKLADQLLPDQPGEARGYGLIKVHKGIAEGKKIPPTRLVISGCSSNTENLSSYLDFKAKHIPGMLDSHLLDTPHLLRFLEQQNENMNQPENAILVSIDVEALYPSIPINEGIEAFKEALNDKKYGDCNVSVPFLIMLLSFVLKFNSFIFNGFYYLQEWGTAIGTKVAPTYANIFMGKLESQLLKDWKGRPPSFWKRFIDDILCLFVGTEDELLEFLKYISAYHSTIKFTCEYRLKDKIVKTKWKNGKFIIENFPILNIRPRSVDFLDCNIWINEKNKFETDLFVKGTDRITYLKPQSAHAPFVTKNIPYSLAYRLKRICSSNDNFLIRLKELECNLLSRGYNSKVVKNAFEKVKIISRTQAIQKVIRVNSNNRPVFCLTYDPRIDSVSNSMKKHFTLASKDPIFKKTFPLMPMIGYKRAKNLGEYLIRAKLYPTQRYEIRDRKGFFKCSKREIGCNLCNRSQNISEHVANFSGKKYPIKSNIKCSDSYVIYSIQCKQCPMQYVGQTSNAASVRFNNHSSDILNKKVTKPVAKHFNSRNHSWADMVFTPFEKLHKKDKTLLDIREKFWIREKQTVEHGLNINS